MPAARGISEAANTKIPPANVDLNGSQNESLALPLQRLPTQPGVAPNGGLQAWSQVLGGFSIFFNTWGLIAAYGVFQTYYESAALFTASASTIAWIGALQSFVTFFTCFITGPIFDRGFLRILLATGAFLVIFGFMMVSLCTSLYQVILAQGLCIGIGSGMLFSTVVPVISQYFSTRLGFAIGLAATGSAIGGIIYPIAFHKLLPSVGFPWSVRILGFLALGTLLPPLLFIRRRHKPAKPRQLLDPTVITDFPYICFTLGQMLAVVGFYSVLFYISSFALSKDTTSPDLAFYLLPILNAGSFPGRVLPNILADRFGALTVAPAGAFICALLVFCLIPITSTASLIVVVAIFGFFSGIFIALPGMALVVLTTDKRRTGERVGMALAFSGFGALAGGPGGGSVLADYGKAMNWTALWIFAGVSMTVGGILFVVALVLYRGKKASNAEGGKTGGG